MLNISDLSDDRCLNKVEEKLLNGAVRHFLSENVLDFLSDELCSAKQVLEIALLFASKRSTLTLIDRDRIQILQRYDLQISKYDQGLGLKAKALTKVD